MLSRFYRIIAVNNTGQTITYNNNGRLNLKITAWYITPATGKIAYTVLSDDAFGSTTGGSLADGAEIKSSEIDNTSTLYLGIIVQLEVTHDEGSAAVGSVDLYFDGGDATGELASDAAGYDTAELNKLRFIGSLYWHASGADDEIMRSGIINL